MVSQKRKKQKKQMKRKKVDWKAILPFGSLVLKLIIEIVKKL